MLERLDRFPDAYGQIREIMRHYRRMSEAREDERLIRIFPKMSTDPDAVREFNEVLGKRAERKDRTIVEEQQAWRERYADRLMGSGGSAGPAGPSVAGRRPR